MNHVSIGPPITIGVTATRDRKVIPIITVDDLKKCISQGFGENMLDWYKRIFKMLGHNGLDIIILRGADIISAHDGVVLEREDSLSAGYGLTIWNKQGKYKTYYWHNLRNLVKVGDKIKRGQVIAHGDSTGWSTGDHLHFGYKETDDKGVTLNWGNGYKGAIDPLPFIDIPKKDMKGKLVKDPYMNGKIWYVFYGVKAHVHSSLFLAFIWDWENVEPIDKKTFDALEKTSPIGFQRSFIKQIIDYLKRK